MLVTSREPVFSPGSKTNKKTLKFSVFPHIYIINVFHYIRALILRIAHRKYA